MKIGIYLNSIKPEEGGASTLLGTIKNALKEQSDNYQYVILYKGNFWGKYKTEIEGVTYFNILAGKRKAFIFLLWKRAVHLGKNIIRYFMCEGYFPFYYGYMDRIAKEEGIDLIWYTQPTRIKTSVPYIYTVWDLGHHVLPMLPEVNCDWYDREVMYQEMLPHASWIITGNEQGKQEIIDSYAVTPSKIRIVPFPVSSFCYGPSAAPQFELPEKYFFYPAQFWAHKNHIVILNALKILKEKYNICPKMFFSGSDKGNKRYIEEECARIGLCDQVSFLGFLSYEELKHIYMNATGMIFASLMGPNNLPPIEAAYLGCPVIITDIPGHREQMGDSALYFEGTDEAALAAQMYAVLSNKDGIVDCLKERMQKTEFCYDYFLGIGEIFHEYEILLRTWKKTK